MGGHLYRRVIAFSVTNAYELVLIISRTFRLSSIANVSCVLRWNLTCNTKPWARSSRIVTSHSLRRSTAKTRKSYTPQNFDNKLLILYGIQTQNHHSWPSVTLNRYLGTSSTPCSQWQRFAQQSTKSHLQAKRKRRCAILTESTLGISCTNIELYVTNRITAQNEASNVVTWVQAKSLESTTW